MSGEKKAKSDAEKDKIFGRNQLIILLVICVILLAAISVLFSGYLNRTENVFGEIRVATDYPSIQAAINDLSSGGGMVYIPAGTYAISSPLSVPSNTTLVGAGYRTIIRVADGANIHAIINDDPAMGNTNILITNLQIDGNKGTQTNTTIDGINFVNVTYSRIEGCWIHDTAQRGVDFWYCDYNIITENQFWDTDRAGVSLEAGNLYNTISENIVLNAQGNGLSAGGNFTTVIGNQVIGAAERGIFIGWSTGCTVTANVCKHNGMHGIAIPWSSGCAITGNIVEGNIEHGIFILNTSDTVVSNNIARNNNQGGGAYDGIHLSGALSLNNLVTGNRCFDNQTEKTQNYGIRTTNGADYTIIVDNNCKDNRKGSIKAAKAHNVIKDNIV